MAGKRKPLPLKNLRIIAVVAPVAFAVAIGLLDDRVLEATFHPFLARAITTIIVAIGVVIFAMWVFSRNADIYEAEERARQRLEALVGSSPAGIFMVDANGHVLVVNREAERIIGFSHDSADTLDRYVRTISYRRADGSLYEPDELPLQRALYKGERVLAERVQFEFPDGHSIPTLLYCAPTCSADGQITGAIAVIDDITPLAEMERLRNELHESERRLAAEWKALFELGREVTASPDLHELLDSTVSRARTLLDTDTATLMLLTADGKSLFMAAHEGLQTPAMQQLRLPAEDGLQGLVLETLQPVIVTDYQTDERLKDRPAAVVSQEAIVSAISVPLVGKSGPLGTLAVGNRRATTFDQRHAELLEAFANWTAVAIETSQLYDKLQSLARLEERERIGMDLHDGVIQSIYAVGLNLEDCTERLGEPPETLRPTLEKAMDDLRKVIKDIRSYIFDLRPQVSQVTDLPDALRQLVEDVRINALIDAKMRVEGAWHHLLDDGQALALFHIAQEALNNVSKHSGASSLHVRLAAQDGRVTLEVEDNGVGFELSDNGPREKQGLRNIRDRARSIGADLSIESEPGQGTRVRVELSTSAVGGTPRSAFDSA